MIRSNKNSKINNTIIQLNKQNLDLWTSSLFLLRYVKAQLNTIISLFKTKYVVL